MKIYFLSALVTLLFTGQSFALSTSKIENHIFQLVNQQRSKHRLPPYRIHNKLTDLARIHSRNMVKHNFFSHKDHAGLSPQARKVKFHPGLLGGIGENIAYHYGKSELIVAKNLISSWMKSPGHRANILSQKYSHIGIGIAAKGRYYYATQTFGDLAADLLQLIPKVIAYESEKDFTFNFLGKFPRDKISIFVNFPDKNAKFFLKNGAYYTGVGKYDPVWSGENFSFRIKFDKGKGYYKIMMGSYGRFYKEGILILVR